MPAMDSDRGKLKHLLVLLLEALSGGTEVSAARLSRLRERIAASGLVEEDVHVLLDWIEEHLLADPRADWPREPLPDAPSAKSFRLFGEPEGEYLTRDGLALLLDLFNTGQIDSAQMEALLQYSSHIAYRPLTPYDLEPILEQVLFRPGRPGLTGGASEGFDNIH
ncbi:DUF494 domain-containing protein [bacterium]|nr:DUF494 domain-containing protein [bacterium]